MASASATSEDLFEVALHTVHSGLSDADRQHFRRFADHRDMLADLRRNVCRYTNDGGKLLRCSRRIAAFSDAFAPFFDVIGVFVQIKPEYAAVFWGTIWFIFKIGSNLVSFLERVSELFEELSFTLPQYQSWYQLCRDAQPRVNSHRLAQAMGLIYHDVIEFSMHIYFMFSKQDQGRIKRALLGRDLLLRPFDFRFSRLKQRLDMHQKWFEVEARIYEQDLVTETNGSFRDYIQTMDRLNVQNAQREQAQKIAHDAQQLRDLRRWLNAPDYATLSEGVSERIFPGTGRWLLQRPEYLSLKNTLLLEDAGSVASDDHNAWLKRVLVLRAKPGFGKTFLSVVMINDMAETVIKEAGIERRPHVAFFHFSQLNRTILQSAELALQAIATQLVHNNRRDRLSLDALGMIETNSGSGQSTASPKDVRAVIAVLLRQHPTCIIIDGIDECHEPERMLEVVRNLSLEHDCRFILLGRPNVRIPPQWTVYQGELLAMDLHADAILGDLQSYLGNRLDDMASRQLFGEGTRSMTDLLRQTSSQLVEDLSRQSEGLFLWARLLVNLLESPAFSPGDRFRILSKPGYLEGLDALYRRTLEVLRRKPIKEQQVAQTLFRWICGSPVATPLKVFHTILAINPGRPTTELDYLPNYPECIPFITGALVEVLPSQDTLSFIHVTFKDFLISSASHPDPRQNLSGPLHPRSARQSHRHMGAVLEHNFQTEHGHRSSSPTRDWTGESYFQPTPFGQPRERLQDPHTRGRVESVEFGIQDQSEAHFFMATTCLSHLAFDIPHRPLTEPGNDGLTEHWQVDAMSNTITAMPRDEIRILAESSRGRLDKNYPFMRYCSLYWHHHLVWAHEAGGPSVSAAHQLDRPQTWLVLLSQFILNRLAVTAWVEAAHAYQSYPLISRLPYLLGYLRPKARPAMTSEARECHWTFLGLQQLAQALKHLQQRHGRELLVNPRKIWDDSIVLAEDDEFWPNWVDDSHVRMPEQERGILGQAGWRNPGDIVSPST